MRATLGQLKSSRAAQTVGVCADSDEFLSLANEAIERLIQRGKWKGSFQRVRLCVSSGCLTLPRQIANITDIAYCSTPVMTRNMFWEFLQNGEGLQPSSGCGCPSRGFIDRGFVSTFEDIPAGYEVRIMPTLAADVGKRVLIQGTDTSNQFVRTLDGSIYVDGVYLTVAAPFAQTTFGFNSITGIQKEVTKGNVLVYAVHPITDNLVLMASLEPGETVASYRRYMVSGYGSPGCACASETKSLTGIAKLEFIPVAVDSDYLYIDNIPAIKEMMQSVKFSEMDSAGAVTNAAIHERAAIRELNHQKRNYNGDESVAIRMGAYGSAHLSRKRIGRLQ